MSVLLFVTFAFGLCGMWIETQRWPWGAVQIAIFLLAAGWLIAYALGRTRIAWRWTLLPPALAAATGALQLLLHTTVDRWQTGEHVLMWATWLAAHWLALQALQDDARRARFFRLCGYLAIAIAVLAILHRATSNGKVFWWFDSGRSVIEGIFPYENQYAAFVLLTLPAVLWECVASKKNRSIWTLGAAVMVASVVSSSSVAGAVLVTVETIAVLWALGAARVRTQLIALLALAAIVGTVSGWRDMALDLERRHPLELRRVLTISTLEMARERPLTGWGLGTWTEVYPAYATFDDGIFDNAAHNDWAEWTAEGGVPMLAAMLAFLAMTLASARRSPLVWGIALVLAYDLIEFHFDARPAFGCFFFAWAGAVFLAVEKSRGVNRPRKILDLAAVNAHTEEVL